MSWEQDENNVMGTRGGKVLSGHVSVMAGCKWGHITGSPATAVKNE